MKFIKLLAVVVCVFLYSDISSALEIGDKAPALNVARWVKGKPVTLFSSDNKDTKMYVVFFWATWSNVSPNLMNFISRENYIFSKDGVVFVGITKEGPSRVKKFLEKFPDVNFSIGIDNKAETYTDYMQGTQGIPVFFIISPDKKLIWKGSPFEANRVLVRALNGTFDAEVQKQIVKYRERIQKATQMMENKEKIYFARKILKLDPTDRIAMNIIIDNFIISGKEIKAIDFISSTRDKTIGNKYIQRELFFLELSIIRGMNNNFAKKKLSELTSSYTTVFNDDQYALNSFAIVVSKDVPLSILPLEKILNICKRAVKLSEDNSQDKEGLSSALQSLARLYYYTGQFNKTISTQGKAIDQIDDKEKDNKEEALLLQEYYKAVLRLSLKLDNSKK